MFSYNKYVRNLIPIVFINTYLLFNFYISTNILQIIMFTTLCYHGNRSMNCYIKESTHRGRYSDIVNLSTCQSCYNSIYNQIQPCIIFKKYFWIEVLPNKALIYHIWRIVFFIKIPFKSEIVDLFLCCCLCRYQKLTKMLHTITVSLTVK